MNILVLNTSHTDPRNFNNRFNRLQAYINACRPDFVLLQEGAGSVASLFLYKTISTLSALQGQLMGYYGVDCRSFFNPWPWMAYYNGAYAKQQIVGKKCIQTPKVSNEGARTATMIVTQTITAVSVHLSSDCDDQGRLQEINTILNNIPQTGVILIGGDFNCGETSVVWQTLRDNGFQIKGKGVDALAVADGNIISVEPVLPGISDHEGLLFKVQ